MFNVTIFSGGQKHAWNNVVRWDYRGKGDIMLHISGGRKTRVLFRSGAVIMEFEKCLCHTPVSVTEYSQKKCQLEAGHEGECCNH